MGDPPKEGESDGTIVAHFPCPRPKGKRMLVNTMAKGRTQALT